MSADSEVSDATSCADRARLPLSTSRTVVRLTMAMIGMTRIRPSLDRIRASRRPNLRRVGPAGLARADLPPRGGLPRAGMVALVRVLTSTPFVETAGRAPLIGFPLTSRRRHTRPHATRHGRDFITSDAFSGSLGPVGIGCRITKRPTSDEYPTPTMRL